MSERGAPTLDALDLCDLDHFANGFPHDIFAMLRDEAPVWWHPATENTPEHEGFWVVTRHADVLSILRDTDSFSSQTGPGRSGAGGTTLIDMPADLVTGVMMNMTDPPAHRRIRGITQQAFTPRTISALDEWLRTIAVDLVTRAVDRCDSDTSVDSSPTLPPNCHSRRSLSSWASRRTTAISCSRGPRRSSTTATAH